MSLLSGVLLIPSLRTMKRQDTEAVRRRLPTSSELTNTLFHSKPDAFSRNGFERLSSSNLLEASFRCSTAPKRNRQLSVS